MSHLEDNVAVKMTDFTHYPSTKKLEELAKKAPDLTADEALSPSRLRTFCTSSCGWKLLFGTERVNDEILTQLQSLAEEAQAVKKMTLMQGGEVLNKIDGHPSENRAVLHTAMRDFFDSPNTTPAAIAASQLAREQCDKLKRFTETIDTEGKFTDLVMVGIGGSDLGPRAIFLALEKFKKPGREVHFIANVDPDDGARVLRGLDLSKTLVVVVSKSGTTLETLTNEEFVKAKFVAQGLKPEKHFIAVTGKGSPLDDPSKYLESFHMWDYVGGRYSATSMVGGVMLSFSLGFDIYWEFLKGASAMDKHALTPNAKENLPLLAALLGVWNHNFLGHPTTAVIPYSQALNRFPAHLQQCDMESNGKQVDKRGNTVSFETGPVVWGEPGTNGQHSFFQLIHQGTTPVPVQFIGFKESQWGDDINVQGTTSQQKLLSNLFAQAIALATGQKDTNPNKTFPGNRPSHVLLGKQLTPFAMGSLLSFYEHKIAFQGFIWNINSFDQEGVQLGKVLANKIIDCFIAQENSDPTPFPEGEAMLEHLKQF